MARAIIVPFDGFVAMSDPHSDHVAGAATRATLARHGKVKVTASTAEVNGGFD
jgi:hypothetical protein